AGALELWCLRLLADLDEPETSILTALAVLGRAATLARLLPVAGLDPGTEFDAVDRLIDRGLIIASGAAVCFVHEIVRERVYRSIHSPRCRQLHGLVAELLEQESFTPGVIALHFSLSFQESRAFAYAMRAARANHEVHSYVDADYYARLATSVASVAADLAEAACLRASILLEMRKPAEALPILRRYESVLKQDGNELGLMMLAQAELEAAWACGIYDASTVAQQASALVASAQRLGRLDRLIAAVASLAAAANATGRRELVNDVLLVLEERVETIDDPSWHAELLCTAARLYCCCGKLSGAERASDAALIAAEKSEYAGHRVLALAAAGVTALTAGRLALAAQNFERALELIESEELDQLRRLVTNDYAIVLLEQGHANRARDILAEYVRVATRQDATIALANLATVYFWSENWARLESVVDELVGAVVATQAHSVSIAATAFRGILDLRKHGAEKARVSYDRLVELVPADGDILGDPSYAHMFLARYRVAIGDAPLAASGLRSAIAHTKDGDKLATWRLRLELSGVVGHGDPDLGWRIAHDVSVQAQTVGAILIHNRATAIAGAFG
ncbi:MAG: hypothetical protein ACREL7_01305, partial [Longimicrobiales bacterium]